MKEIEIRGNWVAALSGVKAGDELSGSILYEFTDQDLIVLCYLHECGLYQEKIEDLLEDCNFHHEADLLSVGSYDTLRKEVMETTRKDHDDSIKSRLESAFNYAKELTNSSLDISALYEAIEFDPVGETNSIGQWETFEETIDQLYDNPHEMMIGLDKYSKKIEDEIQR